MKKKININSHDWMFWFRFLFQIIFKDCKIAIYIVSSRINFGDCFKCLHNTDDMNSKTLQECCNATGMKNEAWIINLFSKMVLVT